MKSIIAFIAILCCLLCFQHVQAQDVIRRASCNDETILRQADSVKKQMIAQGFIVAKEASMAMESEYEMAIMVPLAQGSLYHFVFIGDVGSKIYEVKMYDPDDEVVASEKKMWADVDGNVINFPFVPKVTQYYNIRPVQVNKKKKNLCGYVMLLKKVK